VIRSASVCASRSKLVPSNKGIVRVILEYVMFLHGGIGFGLFVESSSFRTSESHRSNGVDIPLKDELLRTKEANNRAHAILPVVTILPCVVVIFYRFEFASSKKFAGN